ncbi:MAG: ACP S-malonyltransferase, partial [Anaerolineae bacterium]
MCSLAYIFPGQGSQRVGMGRALYESSPAVRALFQRADALLDFPLEQLCFEGPEEALTETRHAQPALLVTALAFWEWARAQGAPAPAFLAGHSLGHFSALAAAGALDFEDALRLVRARAEAMQDAAARHAGGMAAVIRLARPALEQVCQQASAETGAYVGIANDNSPEQLVISGERRALERAMELAKEAGARRVVPLAVSGAFHSPLMESAAEAFRAAAGAVPIC